MRSATKWIIPLIIIVAALFWFIMNRPIARLNAGSGVEVIISADTSWEIARPYFYEVHRGATVLVPKTFLGAGQEGGLSFQLVMTTDKKLVGVIEADSPDVVLALFDLDSGESWPRAGYTEHHTSTHQRGTTLLSRLQLSHPSTKFILSDDVPGNRSTKL